jgi:hypothetical protein
MFVLFNKDNKEFLGYSEAEPQNKEEFLFKLVPEDKTNLLQWEWKGDYDNGKMMPLQLPEPEIEKDVYLKQKSYAILIDNINKKSDPYVVIYTLLKHFYSKDQSKKLKKHFKNYDKNFKKHKKRLKKL